MKCIIPSHLLIKNEVILNEDEITPVFFSVEFEDVDSTFRIKTLSSIFYIGRGTLT
jgi:hypothetical protein